jgi:hypothetical protein
LPRWIQFMNEIPRGDEELARYVRLWIGYGASQLRFQEAHGSRLFRQGKPRALLEVKSPNIPTAIYEARLRGYDRAPPKRTLHRCGRSDSVCVFIMLILEPRRGRGGDAAPHLLPQDDLPP